MVFVDTSFLVAAAVKRDDRHPAALALRDEAMSAHLHTTNHVVGEAWTTMLGRYGRHAAVKVLRALRSPRYTIIHASPEIEARAIEWLLRHDEGRCSFVDAVSFEVMKERGIERALAFDRDFEAAGFRTLGS